MKTFLLVSLLTFLSPISLIGNTKYDGIASYYSSDFNGRQTASGERFSNSKRTAAHRRYPIGTLLRVTNLKNGKSTVVRINDRGPFIKGRVLDMSRAAAKDIGIIKSGIAKVRLSVVSNP